MIYLARETRRSLAKTGLAPRPASGHAPLLGPRAGVRRAGRRAPVSPMSRAISCSRATRFSTLGWVENRLSMRAPGQRIDDEQMRRGGIALGRHVGDVLRGAGDLLQGRGERQRTPADLGAGLVGLVFARAADRHLHQPRGERRRGSAARACRRSRYCCCCCGRRRTKPKLASIEIAPAMRRGDGHQQRVAVFDVAELMRDHAGELLVADGVEQAGRDGDGGVLRDCGRWQRRSAAGSP